MRQAEGPNNIDAESSAKIRFCLEELAIFLEELMVRALEGAEGALLATPRRPFPAGSSQICPYQGHAPPKGASI